jgi:hypothetical protein
LPTRPPDNELDRWLLQRGEKVRDVVPTSRKQTTKARAKKQPVRLLSPAQVAAAVRTMGAASGTQRFAAGKALTATAQRDPPRVYPHFEALAALLDSNSQVVRWNALQILGALAGVDEDRQIDALLARILDFMTAGKLITAANAIGCAAEIGRARSDLLDRIVTRMLAVENTTYDTPECRNVAIGHVLNALRQLWPNVHGRADVAAFVRRQQANPRPKVARSAAELAVHLTAF